MLASTLFKKLYFAGDYAEFASDLQKLFPIIS